MKTSTGRGSIRRTALLALIAASGFSAHASEHIPTEHFAALPGFDNVRLSPDGTRLAAITNMVSEEFTGRFVFEQRLDNGAQKILLSLPDSEFRINWIRWASNRHLLVSFRGHDDVRGTQFTTTRLYVVDTESAESDNVLSTTMLSRAKNIPQFQDQVIDIMPEDERYILMQADLEVPNRPDVYRVSLKTGKARRVEKGRTGIRTWLTDRQHRVRMAIHRDETTIKIYERGPDSDRFRVLWQYEALSEGEVTPLGFAGDPNVLYVRAYHEGRKAVFRVDLADPELPRELVYSNPTFDVSGNLVYSPKSRDVVGIRTGIGGTYEFWSDEHRLLIESVRAALPDYYNGILSMSRDERRMVFFSQNDTNAGTYFYLDRDTKQMSTVAPRYENLPPEQMAETKVLFYEARDGTRIQAFLTLPRGSEADNLPAIVFPHGGPMAFDSDSFDYWSQLFANRGYAVMKMNFRGSAGFGYEFMAAGLQQWGNAMQDDVADATQWLIDKGIADPERICIVGGSYGGYAALMGVATTPELYRCAVSFAGVTDLAALVAMSRRYTNSDIAELQLGSKGRDLKARSPVNRAESIEDPVLLIHGADDVIVHVRQSRRMAKALERLEKEFTYIEQPGGDHNLSTNAQRIETLTAIEAFLAEHLD